MATVVMSTRPLFLEDATDYTALDLRAMLDAPYFEGVDGQSSLSVSEKAGGTNMSVDVDWGTAVIEGNSPSGSRKYLVHTDTTTNVALDAAPGSNSRIDLIVAEIRDGAVGGGANDDWVLRSVTGTAAASPSVPVLPGSSIELARVTVASGTSAITDAMITDRRTDMNRVGHYAAYQPAQVINGQLISDYGTNRVYQGRSGSWVDINALSMELTTRDGGAIFGGTPPVNTVYKWEYGQKVTSFTEGRGHIFTEHTFTGICWAQCFSIGNSQAYVFSRRTSGDATLNGDQIPITGVAVSALGNAAASGDITVAYLVVGW